MSIFGLQLHHTRRLTALALILVCAWMGTGGVLHHTEEQSAGSIGSQSSGSVHHQTAAAPLDACAACEWTQGLQGKTLALYHVQMPLFLVRPRSIALTPAPVRRSLRLRSPRAPPACVTCC